MRQNRSMMAIEAERRPDDVLDAAQRRAVVRDFQWFCDRVSASARAKGLTEEALADILDPSSEASGHSSPKNPA